MEPEFFDWDDAEYEEEEDLDEEEDQDQVDIPAPIAAETIGPVPPAKPKRKPFVSPIRFREPRRITMVAVLGIAILGALIVWRDRAAMIFPDLASLYSLAGMPVNIRGLDFADVETSESVENGVPVLLVTGTIENVAGKTVDVPRVRLAVRGTGGREIYVWTAMPARSNLPPGDSLPFVARLASPPAGGRDVSVRFLNQRDALFNASARVTQ